MGGHTIKHPIKEKNFVGIYDYLLILFVAVSILVQGSYFPAEYISMFILLCLLLLFAVKKGQASYRFDKRLLLFSAIYSLMFLFSTIIASTDKYTGALESFKAVGFTLFIAAAGFLINRESMLKAVLAGSLVVSIIGILAYMDMFSLFKAVLYDGRSYRLQSVFEYANVSALLSGLGFIAAYYFMDSKANFKERVKYFLYGYVSLVALILTLSRGSIAVFLGMLAFWLILYKSFYKSINVLINLSGAFLVTFFMYRLAEGHSYSLMVLVFAASLIIMTGVFYFLDKPKRYGKKHVIAFAGLGAAFIAVAASINLQGLSRIFRISLFDGTLVERFIYVKDAVAAIQGNLFLGIGPGNWSSQQYFYQTAQYYSRYIHSSLIQFTVDAGVIALMAFAGLLITYYINAFKILKSKKDNFQKTLMALITFIILHSLIDVDLSFMPVLLILAGLVSVSFKEEKSGGLELLKGKIQRNVIITTAIIMLCSASFYLTGQIISGYADSNLKKGNTPEAISLYKAATVFKPFDGSTYVGMAQCYDKENMDEKLIMECFDKAYSLNKYEPKFLASEIDFKMKTDDPRSIYQISRKLIEIQPLIEENYTIATKELLFMYKNKLVDLKEFRKEGSELISLVQQVNSRITPSSKYLQKQSPIVLEKEFTDMFGQR